MQLFSVISGLFCFVLLTGCETDGVSWNRLDRISDFPYTGGHRWVNGERAPPKGNCLGYALAVQKAFKAVGVKSRIMIVQPDSQEIEIQPSIYFWNVNTDFLERVPRTEWVKGSPMHAIVVYRADNGRTHLVDNSVDMPVLAKGTTDDGWAQQMMPAFVHAQVVDHDYHQFYELQMPDRNQGVRNDQRLSRYR